MAVRPLRDHENEPGERVPLSDHLDELRRRVFVSLTVIFISFFALWFFAEPLLGFLERPLLQAFPKGVGHLYFTGVADKFLVSVRVAFMSAVGLTSPFWLYQLWRYISPGLHPHERRFASGFLLLGYVGFLSGLAFAYFFCLPFGYKFLIEYGSPADVPIITLPEYFGLTIKLLVTMGLVFELPALMMLLGQLGLVDAVMLRKYRRHAFFGSAVGAAIVAPTPDAITMVLTMMPLYLLYEAGIVIVRISMGSPKKGEARAVDGKEAEKRSA